ncbi:cold shock protein 2-like [Zingiber officinale]|nr:cold shock protein 2-like [Zingiber officinale]
MRTNDALLLFLLLLLATAAAGRGLGGNDKPPGEVTVSTDSFIPGPGGRFYGGGNDFPGFRGGGGWGGGYGGPSSGYARSGVVAPPSVVCAEMGPCYKKKLTCPASCFTSYSYSGKGYGGGGGGGGCTMDCKKQCVAYC